MKTRVLLILCIAFAQFGSALGTEQAKPKPYPSLQNETAKPEPQTGNRQSPGKPLKGEVTETELESNLLQLGILLAQHKPGVLPATVSEVTLGSRAFYGGIAKNDLVTGVQKTDMVTSITINRAGKVYSARLSLTTPFNLAENKTILPAAAEQKKRGRQLGTTGDGHFLQIRIGSGGTSYINSFNGRPIIHKMLMELADLFAAAANNVQLPAGAIPAGIFIDHDGDKPITDAYNDEASIKNYFADFRYSLTYWRKNDGFKTLYLACPDINQSQAPVVAEHKITLAPLKLIIDLGGGSFSNAFNNGTGLCIIKISGFTNPISANILPGAGLAEQATTQLRPTLLQFSIGGSRGTNCFNEAEPHLGAGGGGNIQAVPTRQILEASRPVTVELGWGGSHCENSFNNSGSVTVLVNEFLDRLTARMDPSILAEINDLDFETDPRFTTNSFNGR